MSDNRMDQSVTKKMFSRLIGYSVEGLLIEVHEFGRGAQGRLILAGFHGDEPKSVYVARQLCTYLSGLDSAYRGPSILIVPVVNPDGYLRRRRKNANGTDLNRNFPTANWEAGSPRRRSYGGTAPGSEPETQAVMGLIEAFKPTEIISIHSISDHRYCNNYDGPGAELAKAMAAHNEYPATESIGYPTPGSFGTWAGRELGIPTVTLELPSHHSSRQCWEENRSALLVE